MHPLMNHYHNRVQWVELIDSWKKWPTFWISACTHWWEYAGLRVIDHLLNSTWLKSQLVCGKVFLILANIQAYQFSFQCKHPADARFIDENLNRCCTKENLLYGTSYEAWRASELETILAGLDYHLDIHSTYSKSQALWIVTEKWKTEIGEVLNVDVIYENLTEIQVGKPFIDITERNGGIWIWLEAWWEMDETWFLIGVENCLRLLIHFNMLNETNLNLQEFHRKENRKIEVYSSIVPKGKHFQPVKNFQHNDEVQKGEIIGSDDKHSYPVSEDSIILMPSVPEKLKVILEKGQIEEYCFLWRTS